MRYTGSRAARRWGFAGRLSGVLGVLALVSVVCAPGAGAGAGAPYPTVGAGTSVPNPIDAAGSDTNLPATDSAVTIHGKGDFSSMVFTVNQTKELVNQAVSISWTGGIPSDSVTNIANNYVQIMECWGDPVTAADGTQGPPPQNCEFGGQSQKSWQGNVPGVRVASDYRHYEDRDADGSPQVDVPFDAVDGTTVSEMFNNTFDPETGGSWWLNPYFSYYSTDEIPYAPTYADGTGSQLFTADTGLEAPGLGCGQAVQPLAHGADKVPQCWVVIVPRSNFTQELGGQPPYDLGPGVQGAPFQPRVWANRIAIPLDFKPLDTSCRLGVKERRIVGSELLAPAMSNWTPALCASADSSPFNYASLSDTQARSQLIGAASGGAGMSVVSRPLDPSTIPDGDTVTYAPVALTGLVIGFNIERVMNANLDANGQIPAAEEALTSQRVAHINLTPRLVAKLLSESYQASFLGLPTGAAYDWARKNPATLAADPEFIKYNPEFQLLSSATGPAMAGLVVELNASDAAYELWQWILADPQAAAWLNGTPDEFGMKVNPYYSTNAKSNPAGVGLTLPVANFPKNDPYTIKIPEYPTSFQALGMLDVMPYENSMKAAALAVRTTDMGDKTSYDPTLGGIGYQANGPQYQGSRFIMSVTDAASAAQYGLQIAALRNAAGKFVVPSTQSLLAGEKAMKGSSAPGVLTSDPGSTSPDAYPLTDLVYAAAIPQVMDAGSRKDFASLIRFVARSGQTPGVAFGQLPPGYAPLPANLGQQALDASEIISRGGPSSPTTSSPTSTPTTTATTRQSTSSASSQRQTATSTPSGQSETSTSTRFPATSGNAAPTYPPAHTTAQPDAAGDSHPGSSTRSASSTVSSRPTKSAKSAPVVRTPSARSTTSAAATTNQVSASVPGPGLAPESTALPGLVALRTPRDPVTPPVVPIAFGVGLVAAVLAPFINRRRSRH